MCLIKNMILQKNINLLNKTHDFTKKHKFANEKWKGVNSDKNKSISAGLQ